MLCCFLILHAFCSPLLICLAFFPTECGMDSGSWQLRLYWVDSKKGKHVILSSSHMAGVWPQAVYQISLILPQTLTIHF